MLGEKSHRGRPPCPSLSIRDLQAHTTWLSSSPRAANVMAGAIGGGGVSFSPDFPTPIQSPVFGNDSKPEMSLNPSHLSITGKGRKNHCCFSLFT